MLDIASPRIEKTHIGNGIYVEFKNSEIILTNESDPDGLWQTHFDAGATQGFLDFIQKVRDEI